MAEAIINAVEKKINDYISQKEEEESKKQNTNGGTAQGNSGGTSNGGTQTQTQSQSQPKTQTQPQSKEYSIDGLGNLDQYKYQGGESKDTTFVGKVNKLFGVIRMIGIIVSVMALMAIGVRYMVVSVEELNTKKQ